MPRRQNELKFIVGIDKGKELNSINEFIKNVASAISTICGGCMVETTSGYWRDDGAGKADTFIGNLNEERTIIFTVSCEVIKTMRAYEYIRAQIAVWSDWYELDVGWVHVQQTSFTGRHFHVSEDPSLSASGRAVYRDIVSPGTRKARA